MMMLSIPWQKCYANKIFLTTLAGSLLALAFAPFNFAYLAMLCPTILFYCCRSATATQAFYYGGLFGLGFFAMGVSWVYVSIHVYGHTPVSVSLLLTSLFIIGLSLLIAIPCYGFARLSRQSMSQQPLIFASCWLVAELIRSHLFGGFPWLLLGISQINSVLKAWIPIFGVYGCSWLVVFLGSQTVELWRTQQYKILLLFVVLAMISPVYLNIYLQNHPWIMQTEHKLRVSLIQGNIEQQQKWKTEQLTNTLALYKNLTAQHNQSDLIIWPESALPIPMRWITAYLDQLDQRAKQHHSGLIIGVIDKISDQQYYNTALALGAANGRYDKKHLVPFGETVPFAKYLRGIISFFNLPMSNFIAGKTSTTLIDYQNIPIAVSICYDIAYATPLWQQLPKAQLIVVISNDAWFQQSFARAQHLQIAQFRARQTGRYLLFSTNNGLTAIIDPNGNIQNQIPPDQTAVLTAQIKPMQGATPWSYYGDLPIILSILLITFATAKLINRSIKR